MSEDNPFLQGATSGLAVNNGDTYTTFMPPKRMSPGREIGQVNYTNVEDIGDLPFQLYAEGKYQDFERLNSLVENAGFSSFSQALQAAAMDPLKGSRTWREYLAARAADPRVQEYVSASRGGGSGGVSNSVNTSISESSRSQAGAILDQNFQSELGRTASKQEIIDFQEALNEQQRSNPTVTTSRSVSGKGSSTSTTQSKGGFDYTRFARQYAQRQPEFKDRYAAVTFMSLLDSAISNPNVLDELVAGQ